MSWFVEHLRSDGTVLARVAMTGPALRIGRALDNDLVLDDPHCAAHHAALQIDTAGKARLHDLGSRNRIVAARGQRVAIYDVASDAPVRLGQSWIRVRSSDWPLPPELPLSARAAWPLALLGMLLVLAHGAWQTWLGDTGENSPPYLYSLAALAVGLFIWSSAYALLGRLVSGTQRFFSHLGIASAGYLAVTAGHNLLELLSFASAWLWPMRIAPYVAIVIVALTVRAHLRLADPRHWPAFRVAVAGATALAIVVPLAQNWISTQRLTNVQTLGSVEHPALRLATPVSVQALSESAATLKARVDYARTKDPQGNDLFGDDDGAP